MSELPKRKDYASDSDFLDAMADYHGIDRRMLRHIPIPKMTHDDDTCPHLVRANLLEAENARLKAEVQRLKHRAEGLREAGDELWFCVLGGLSHAEVQEAVEDWQDMRAKQ